MDYSERLQNVSVLGAAGKMGSGILLLTAVEMADQSLKPENRGKKFVLNAIDVSYDELSGLLDYLRTQVLKVAEKKVVLLRELYAGRADLIENSEIIDQYVLDVMRIVRPVTSLEVAYEADLIFEAVNENKSLKVKLLSQIEQHNRKDPWFLTNTSSVPIHEINTAVDLGGRIIGFHFYNPPAVQKLVEVISPEGIVPELKDFALKFAKNLKKVVVESNDFAGFIGNGHFMRDALHGITVASKLAGESSLPKGIYMVNKVSQDFLVRPMGIFQLIDYVGVDVVQFIMQVMNPHLTDENLHSELLDQMMEKGIRGGQHSDGSQKDGFLKYEKGRPVAVIDHHSGQYIPFDQLAAECDPKLGTLPSAAVAWKNVIRMKNKEELLAAHFESLKKAGTPGAKLAVEYGARSCAIGKKLVTDQVALSEKDVNTVMMTGFFHAYGPVNEYFAS
jgi:3-hydroxyacyl-CoA dehydrogenase